MQQWIFLCGGMLLFLFDTCLAVKLQSHMDTLPILKLGYLLYYYWYVRVLYRFWKKFPYKIHNWQFFPLIIWVIYSLSWWYFFAASIILILVKSNLSVFIFLFFLSLAYLWNYCNIEYTGGCLGLVEWRSFGEWTMTANGHRVLF